MRIDWMGMTTGRVKMPRIVWTCDCGHQNFATGRFSRTLWCDQEAGCGRRFEVEINPMPDRQLEDPPARERRQAERDEPEIEGGPVVSELVNTTDDADAVYRHELARHLFAAHDLSAGWLEGADVEEMECEHAGDHTDPAGLQEAFRDSVPPRNGTIHTHRQAGGQESS